MENDDIFINSRAYKLFGKEMLKDKELRDNLISLEEVINIKRNINIMYNTDDPENIKDLIGKIVNGIKVNKKDYEYALLIHETYTSLYDKCRDILLKD